MVVRRSQSVGTRNRPRRAARRRRDARESASASSSAAPGASPATAGSTRGRARRRRCARSRSREPRAGGTTPARSRRSSRRAASTGPPVERDPFEVPLAEKIELCLRAEEALAARGVKVDPGFGPGAARAASSFASSDGADVDQELGECGAGIDALARADGLVQIAQLPERPRRLERAGRLGVRRAARARTRGAARRRGGGRAPPRRPVPGRGDDPRPRRGADAAPGARVGRPSDRARPDLRDRGGVRGHELPRARTTSARSATAPSS